MALSSSVIWEVRSTATAGNLNSGGFNPSNAAGNTTDYSQSDGPQYSFTDLASTSGTTNPSVVTSASHNFVTADVGNLIHINAGTNWSQGWYEIVSVAGNAATLDRACGSLATITAGTWRVGGALSLGQGTGSAQDSTWAALVTAAMIVYIKRGTYITAVANITFGNGGPATRTKILGYNSTRGDAPTGTNRPVLSIAGGQVTSGTENIVENIIFTGNPVGTPVAIASARSRWNNCKITNTTTTASQIGITVNGGTIFLACEFVSYRGVAASCSASGTTFMYGCYIHDSDTGILGASGTAGSAFIQCILAGNVTYAMDFTGTANSLVMAAGCTFYGAEDKLGTGVILGNSAFGHTFLNNIFYGLATGLNDTNGVGRSFSNYNTFYNNTANYSTFTAGPNDVTTNPAFTSVAEVTGTTATTSGSTLTDSAANFSAVVDSQDYVYIKSGTGVTAGVYLIIGHTTTSLTLDTAPGTSAVADKVYQVTTGKNFGVGTAMKALGFPGAFPIPTTSYIDLGAAQRQGDGTVPAAADVRIGVATGFTTGVLNLPITANVLSGITYDNGTQTGTLVSPSAADVAAAVWNEAISSHTTTSQFGGFIQSLLTLVQFLGLK